MEESNQSTRSFTRSPLTFCSCIAGAVLLALVVFASTQQIVQVPIAGSNLKATFAQIVPYVSGLNKLFGPWTSELLQEPAGTNMGLLLRVGDPALHIIGVLTVLGVLAALAAIVLAFRKSHRKLARTLGIVGFACSALVPVVIFVAAGIVNHEFSAGPIEPVTLLVALPATYLWAISAVLGIIAVIMATRPTKLGESDYRINL